MLRLVRLGILVCLNSVLIRVLALLQVGTLFILLLAVVEPFQRTQLLISVILVVVFARSCCLLRSLSSFRQLSNHRWCFLLACRGLLRPSVCWVLTLRLFFLSLLLLLQCQRAYLGRSSFPQTRWLNASVNKVLVTTKHRWIAHTNALDLGISRLGCSVLTFKVAWEVVMGFGGAVKWWLRVSLKGLPSPRARLIRFFPVIWTAVGCKLRGHWHAMHSGDWLAIVAEVIFCFRITMQTCFY